MQGFWETFVIILIIKIVTADNVCQVQKYNDECLCSTSTTINKNTNRDEPTYCMKCPTTNNTLNPMRFEIELSFSRNNISITCVSNMSLSKFHYEINPHQLRIKHLYLINCSLEDDEDLIKIARLVKAENVSSLFFINGARSHALTMPQAPHGLLQASNSTMINKYLNLRKEHLRGFSNVVELHIKGNDFLGELDGNLLEFVPQLTELCLQNCIVESIPKNFFSIVTNLAILELMFNQIDSVEPGTFKNLKRLETLITSGREIVKFHNNIFDDLLSIQTLYLHGVDLVKWPQDIFNNLHQMQQIFLDGNHFEKLPKNLFRNNTRLEKISLSNSRQLETLPSGLFSNLQNLVDVKLHASNLQTFPEDLFWGSTKLTEIRLQEHNLKTLPERLFDGLGKLEVLVLSDNSIEYLPEKIFDSCKNLRLLSLARNKVKRIPSSLFGSLENLHELHMENNNVMEIEEGAFANFMEVTIINFSHNNLEDLKSNAHSDTSVFSNCSRLKRLDLSFNKISAILSDWIINPPNSPLPALNKNSRPSVLSGKKKYVDIQIDLSNNRITTIDLSGDFENRFRNENKNNLLLDLEKNPISCDCLLYDFLRHSDGTMDRQIRHRLKIQVGSTECSSPKEFQGVPLRSLKSKGFKCITSTIEKFDNVSMCPESCERWKIPSNHTLYFDCSNQNLTRAPETLCNAANGDYSIVLDMAGNSIENIPDFNQPGYQKVVQLSLAQNEIKTIPEGSFPPELKILELHDNKLTALSSEALRRLNSSSLQAVTLGGNPWKCNCKVEEFHDFIKINNNLIGDAEQIVCDSSKKLIKDLTKNIMCPVENKREANVGIYLVIAVLCATVAILAFIAIYYRYQLEIKIWLYAHQMCLWFVTEEDLDKDKLYDAFISYSHKDEDFVVDELISKLEGGPRPFKLCIHFRDWLAGEWIPTQIANSVRDSKRTIVVVSPNFIQSEWGRMEFRAAHSQALNDGRARVILILYGDIGPTDEIDPELKTYMSMNTYVKWGDPWFWDKLRYAMPHKSVIKKNSPTPKISARQYLAAQLNLNRDKSQQSHESIITPL